MSEQVFVRYQCQYLLRIKSGVVPIHTHTHLGQWYTTRWLSFWVLYLCWWYVRTRVHYTLARVDVSIKQLIFLRAQLFYFQVLLFPEEKKQQNKKLESHKNGTGGDSRRIDSTTYVRTYVLLEVCGLWTLAAFNSTQQQQQQRALFSFAIASKLFWVMWVCTTTVHTHSQGEESLSSSSSSSCCCRLLLCGARWNEREREKGEEKRREEHKRRKLLLL